MNKIVHTYKMWISNRHTIKTKNFNSRTSRHTVVSNLPYQWKMSVFSPNNHLKLISVTNIHFFTEDRTDWYYFSGSFLRLLHWIDITWAPPHWNWSFICDCCSINQHSLSGEQFGMRITSYGMFTSTEPVYPCWASSLRTSETVKGKGSEYDYYSLTYTYMWKKVNRKLNFKKRRNSSMMNFLHELLYNYFIFYF